MAFLPPIHDPSTPILPPIQQAHNTHSTQQISQCQNQSRQASHPPLIKLASHLSRSEHYGKWNDRAFTLSVAERPGGLELFALNSFFSKKLPECTFEILIPFPFCWHETTFQKISYLWVSFFPLPFTFFFSSNRHVQTWVMKWRCRNRKSSDSQYWEYWKDPLLICLRCTGA